MSVTLSIVLLIALFAVLGASTTVVVHNIKKIADTLGVPLFLLGLILGILTSFPELSIAINASLTGIQEVSIGNLFGGIFVVFGLVLGLALILNRRIKTDGDVMTPLPSFVLLLVPLVLGLDGSLGVPDGALICLGYVGILAHIYLRNRKNHHIKISITQKRLLVRELLYVIGGTLVIIGVSNLIIKLTVDLLSVFAISGFMVGVIVFSIGTNLPELAVVITSWRKKVKEISFSHMLGSATVNALILGSMAMVKPIAITVNFSYLLMLYFLIIMLAMLLYFYRSGRALSRPEGIVLVLLFALFGYLQTAIQ